MRSFDLAKYHHDHPHDHRILVTLSLRMTSKISQFIMIVIVELETAWRLCYSDWVCVRDSCTCWERWSFANTLFSTFTLLYVPAFAIIELFPVLVHFYTFVFVKVTIAMFILWGPANCTIVGCNCKRNIGSRRPCKNCEKLSLGPAKTSAVPPQTSLWWTTPCWKSWMLWLE